MCTGHQVESDYINHCINAIQPVITAIYMSQMCIVATVLQYCALSFCACFVHSLYKCVCFVHSLYKSLHKRISTGYNIHVPDVYCSHCIVTLHSFFLCMLKVQ